MTRFKVRISLNIASFEQISPKQALKYTIFFNIKKGRKMTRLSNNFITGKPFQKRPNGNHTTHQAQLAFHALIAPKWFDEKKRCFTNKLGRFFVLKRVGLSKYNKFIGFCEVESHLRAYNLYEVVCFFHFLRKCSRLLFFSFSFFFINFMTEFIFRLFSRFRRKSVTEIV